MNIVVAPDSFKGSLSSIQAADFIQKGILAIHPDDTVIKKPMADGGEGTMEALLNSVKGERIPVTCTGPLGGKVNTSYVIFDATTAMIECASISGLADVPTRKRNPDVTTSFGIGEVIIDALNKGCTSIHLGIGGSATIDGGLGMLLALGMKAWDKNGKTVGIYGKDLLHIQSISFKQMDARIKHVSIKIACDVDNPLCGTLGASHVYGPQKGATTQQIRQYDQALNLYSSLIEKEVGNRFKNIQGAGAAGGIGFALLSIGAALVSGAAFIAEMIQLEAAIKQSDLVITGEGQSDKQTLYGKAPGYIAKMANKYQVPTILLSGSLEGDQSLLREHFVGCFSIINRPLTLEESMENAGELLCEQTKQVIHLFDYYKK